MYQVRKRDGKISDFNLSKISSAILKAFEATNKPYNEDIIDLLALKAQIIFHLLCPSLTGYQNLIFCGEAIVTLRPIVSITSALII